MAHQASPKVAVIGAGIAGLTVSESLSGYAEVTVFEKSRGVGGRMSTRYTHQYQFDHGAPFFIARSNAFRRFLKFYSDSGIVKVWNPRVVTLGDDKGIYKREWFEPHYVACPKMNSLCRTLAKDAMVYLNTEVKSLEQQEGAWFLQATNENRFGPFDWVISTVPAPQAAELIPDSFAGFTNIMDCKMQGCYSLMLGFEQALDLNWQAAVVKNSPIRWIAVDSSKPDRKSHSALTIHAATAWSEAHMPDALDAVRDAMLQELDSLSGIEIPSPAFTSLHRWRFAGVAKSSDDEFLVDHALKLGACGDWLLKGDVESACLSAMAMARYLKDSCWAD